MTVTYTAHVATSSFSCFLKLLFRWRGSIYKLVWKDFALFASIYYLLAFLYRFVLNKQQKIMFELISRYCEAHNSLIPVAFVLGFFVTLIITRWWNHIVRIPFADNMALHVMANITGQNERGRLMRRTIMRYMCLSYVIMMSSISVAVKKRFPTFQFMTDAGFMLPNEQHIIENIKTVHNKFFAPLAWATSLINRARREGLINNDFAVKTMMDVIVDFRKDLAHLWIQDWQTVPLVYTQVVTLAVYTFFLSCLMGRQFLDDRNDMPDTFFPIFTFLQFFFYMGWLKVAESMINPFGEDDQDIELNYLIDKNLQVSYIIVDDMHNDHPELIRDQYWDMVEFDVPHTIASEQARTGSYLGSTRQLEKQLSEVPVMDAIDEEVIDKDNEQLINLEHGSRPIPSHGGGPSSLFGMIAESLRSGKSFRATRGACRMPGRSKQGQKNASSPSSHPLRSFQAPDVGSVCSISPPHRPAHYRSREEEMFAMSDFELNKDPSEKHCNNNNCDVRKVRQSHPSNRDDDVRVTRSHHDNNDDEVRKAGNNHHSVNDYYARRFGKSLSSDNDDDARRVTTHHHGNNDYDARRVTTHHHGNNDDDARRVTTHHHGNNDDDVRRLATLHHGNNDDTTARPNRVAVGHGYSLVPRQSTVANFLTKRTDYQLRRNDAFNNLTSADVVNSMRSRRSADPTTLGGLDVTVITPLKDPQADVHPDPDDWSLVACARSRIDEDESSTEQKKELEPRE